MDNIYYPRALNKPTYLFWRYTKEDVLMGGICFVLGNLTSIVGLCPDWVSWFFFFVYMMYRALILAVKPRGWDVHVLKSIFLHPKYLVPGHHRRRCIVTSNVGSAYVSKKGMISKISAIFKARKD